MRTVHLVASAVVGGAIVALVLIIGNLVDIRIEIRRAPAGKASQQTTSDPSKRLPSSTTSIGEQFADHINSPRQIVERAKKLTAAGRLREAQELLLQVLLVNPQDKEAMRGLVHARRLMAGEDAVALRRQARTYRRALSQGTETEEHYTAAAMDLLATANLIAAGDLQDSTVRARTPPVQPKPQPITIKRETVRPKPLTVSKTEQTTPPRPRPEAERKSREVVRENAVRRRPAVTRPSRPVPEQTPVPLTPEPETPIDANEPFATITVGPISSGARASSITTELTVAGYVARMRRGATDYVITLGPYRRSVAERIASRIRSRLGSGTAVSLNPTSN